MIADFFQLGPLPANQLVGSYDLPLVLLSYLVAALASYIALDISGRLREPTNTKSTLLLWLSGGAIAMGAGIWSMHFIGMLAFDIPNMSMEYDLFLTALSLLVAIVASVFALFLLRKQNIDNKRMAMGGVILGIAIATMHYVGMEAMKIHMGIKYVPGLFMLSIIIAIVASEAALWLMVKSNQVVAKLRVRLKLISAMIMGAAICGMHYIGMWAAVFTPIETHMMSYPVDQQLLSTIIAGVTFAILGIAFLASTYKEAMNQQSLLMARQTGQAEMATSVLHNVGNILNSIVIGNDKIIEHLQKSQLDQLTKLGELIQTHKSDLANFITRNPSGSQIPDYIIELGNYWTQQKEQLQSEAEQLRKHIGHIKNIIALQQQFSKRISFEQIVSIADVVEEAIIVVNVQDIKYNIKLIRHYEDLKPVVIDKVKLLQIIINLIGNARDSLVATTQSERIILINITKNEDEKSFSISVIDNGIGISKNQKFSIFSYGFTTKQDGHGFGLHASALSADEMGGTISMTSEGEGKGASFKLTLPYATAKNHSRASNASESIT